MVESVVKELRFEDRLLLYSGIQDLQVKEKFTDCIFITEGGVQIKCHQCIVACSPVLKSILNTNEVKYSGGSPTFSIPDFHPESVKKLLSFLYAGEVGLKRGSRTLIEFKELCNLFQINPPVDKYRNQDGDLKKTQSQDDSGAGPSAEPKQPSKSKESPVWQIKKEKVSEDQHSEQQLLMVDDGFKMPDNFDLPEEIIKSSSKTPQYALSSSMDEAPLVHVQENEVDSTSSPTKEKTRSSKSNTDSSSESETNSVPKSQSRKGNLDKSKLLDDLFGDDEPPKRKADVKSSSNSKSVIDELAEKRKRTISKLKESTSGSVSYLTGSKKPKIDDKKWLVRDDSSSDDEEDFSLYQDKQPKRKLNISKTESPNDDNESIKSILFKKRRRKEQRLSDFSSDSSEEQEIARNKFTGEKSSGLIKVNVQLNGQENFIEYATYKLRLLCSSDGESSSDEDSSSTTPRVRQIRKKNFSSHEETKWDKLKLKRLERSKSVTEIKSIIASKNKMSPEGAKPDYSTENRKPFASGSKHPYQFTYGLSSENKLMTDKGHSNSVGSLKMISFKKKTSSEDNDKTPPIDKSP